MGQFPLSTTGYRVRQMKSRRWQVVVKQGGTWVGRGTYATREEAEAKGVELADWERGHCPKEELYEDCPHDDGARGRASRRVFCDPCSAVLAPLRGHQRSWALDASRIYNVCPVTIAGWCNGWTCNICGADVSGPGSACLDHHHATDLPRGVLCRRCNLGMSFIDDPVWLSAARRYARGDS